MSTKAKDILVTYESGNYDKNISTQKRIAALLLDEEPVKDKLKKIVFHLKRLAEFELFRLKNLFYRLFETNFANETKEHAATLFLPEKTEIPDNAAVIFVNNPDKYSAEHQAFEELLKHQDNKDKHAKKSLSLMRVVSIRNTKKINNTTYYANTPDPWLMLFPSSGQFPSGLVEIKFIWESDIPCQPLLYVDSGSGFFERETIKLCAVVSGISKTIVLLPKKVNALRLDPFENCGKFKLSSIEVRKISNLSYDEITEIYQNLIFLDDSYNINLTRFFKEKESDKSYHEWVKKYQILSEDDKLIIQNQIKQFASKPKISVLMPVYKADLALLTLAIESVQRQLYEKWELCIADDCSEDEDLINLLKNKKSKDNRIKIVFRNLNGHISECSNSALNLATGDFVTFLDQDDLLSEDALFQVAKEINHYPKSKLIYSDEDKILPVYKSGKETLPNEQANIKRFDPNFKPDWNPDLLLQQNYINHLAVYKTSIVKKLSGFRKGYEGSQDWDLALRVTEHIEPEEIRHIPRVLYHWRSISGSTAVTVANKPYAIETGLSAVSEALARRELDAEVMFDKQKHLYQIKCSKNISNQCITLIIPTRNNLEDFKRCLDSILLKSSYRNYKIIIVDNLSDDPATIRYLSKVAMNPKIKVMHFDRPFNFSAINNLAARNCDSEFIGFINDDVEVISENWIEEMIFHAQRKEVGAVGAKLLYPNNTIQHAGVILGVGGVANHAFRGFPSNHAGHHNRANLAHNVSAVTGACMIMRKSVFDKAKGFDENNLKVSFNDVDLCLRLRGAGFINVWTPYALLYHRESSTRGLPDDTKEKKDLFEQEVSYMQRKWGKHLFADPAYNPNLSLEEANFELAFPPRVYKI